MGAIEGYEGVVVAHWDIVVDLACSVEFGEVFERINVTRDGCGVFRCMPIEGILSGFERDLNEWVKNTRNVMKNLDLGVDEKWLKGTNRVEMIRFLDK